MSGKQLGNLEDRLVRNQILYILKPLVINSSHFFMNKAYEEIIDFIAAGTTPHSLTQFQTSEIVKERVSDLIFQEKNGTLSTAEKSELDHYMVLEHLLRLAKAKAYEYISQQ